VRKAAHNKREAACRAVSDGLPNRQVVIADGPHPPVELVTVAATLEHGWSRRPCPPCARSIGIWRSLTDNNGRLQEGLTCGTGVASDVNGLPGRAFQALDRWATPGPHPGHERPDRSGQHRSSPVRHLPSSSAKPRQTSQVATTRPGSLTQKRSPSWPSYASSAELGPRWVRMATVAHGHERSPTVTNGSEEPQVAGPLGQEAAMTRAGDSDCGPDGRERSSASGRASGHR
jgi:hypothetical protein